MRHRAVDLAALGLELRLAQVQVEQRPQRIQTRPEHRSGREDLLGRIHFPNPHPAAEIVDILLVPAPVEAHAENMTLRRDHAETGVSGKRSIKSPRVLNRQQLGQQITPPAIAISPMQRALRMYL